MATLLTPRLFCGRALAAPRVSAPTAFTAAFTTSALKQQQQAPFQQRQITAQRPSLTSQIPRATFARSASTSASQQEAPDHVLTWNRFFDLRRKRRWINLGCSVVTAVATVGVAAPMLAQYDFDSWGAQISGLDPIIVLGISTFAIAAGGWLIGPTLGNLGFGMWASRRGWKVGIAEKEKSFYARVKRYRADASASSPQNPIPDYYGEKIGSVQSYRRWLKDQKAFNLKKNKNMI
ncbi:Putative mitochondrial import protein Pam17 [Septoria linicola]|uniref:Presequence translocated-associated motor subunit PAM17 n=1 Tax=Septoria linicola TaxID=215465 RepID=A0A9Q9B695_9PEZI|nr:putative mitochondrial import protein Pam17 [Septoria linicola]USW57921.1 Putative mitochondrial import protein Pam17 [Septoria linicola]